MTKIEEIFKAWRISFDPNHDQAELASKRIEICDACEFKQIVSLGTVEFLTRCSACGCALKGKIFTPKTYKDEGGSCPHNKWKDVEDQYLNKNEE
jgi:hypothetical protein